MQERAFPMVVHSVADFVFELVVTSGVDRTKEHHGGTYRRCVRKRMLLTLTGSLTVGLLALVVLIIVSAHQRACYPWADNVLKEPLTCTKNERWKWQTISEMTARSGATAEALSGLGALLVIVVYHALHTFKRRWKNLSTNDDRVWPLVFVTYYVGSVGFLGLTVWNLRVESVVHSCFTAQTIAALSVQIILLVQLKPSRVSKALFGLSAIAMLEYIIMYFVHDSPPLGDSYFDFKYHSHVIGQYLFFISYLLLMITFSMDAKKSYTLARI